jgi:hypothetical protein
MEKKIVIELTPGEAMILFEAVERRFKLADFESREETDSVLHKVDRAFQEALVLVRK